MQKFSNLIILCIYVNAVYSISLIVRGTIYICKPMNALEVSRIARFWSDFWKKKILGEDLQTPLSSQLHQVKR